MRLLAGIDTRIATSPNTINTSSAQNSVRPHDDRSLLVAYPYEPRAATSAAVAPAACQSAAGSPFA
jgi:hypothetical protein